MLVGDVVAIVRDQPVEDITVVIALLNRDAVVVKQGQFAVLVGDRVFLAIDRKPIVCPLVVPKLVLL